MQQDDPAPILTGPDDALDRLAEWGRESRSLAQRRDPLIKAALAGPLAHHGGLQKGLEVTGLTAQTLRRIKGRDDIPVLAKDTSAEVDWDGYADYLATEAAEIREALSRMPSAAARTPTAYELRAGLLEDLAERVRNTEISDVGYWALTLELRNEAQDAENPVIVLQDDWRETPESTHERAQYARILHEVADQITRFRTDGEAGFEHLDPAVLARARAELAPAPASQLVGEEDAKQPLHPADSPSEAKPEQGEHS